MPKSYSFRASYSGARADEQQDISGDPMVVVDPYNPYDYAEGIG
ncbi:MAG: hypothetical protein P8X42_14525 [Calditrichaceae bacterium]